MPLTTGVIGFQDRSDDPELADLDASPLNLFIVADPGFRGPVPELLVDDLELEQRGNDEGLRAAGRGQEE